MVTRHWNFKVRDVIKKTNRYFIRAESVSRYFENHETPNFLIMLTREQCMGNSNLKAKKVWRGK